MKILWLVNVSLPEFSMLMNEKPTPFGGWLIQTSQMISKQKDIELSIAFPKQNQGQISKVQGKKIAYYPFSNKNKNEEIKGLTSIIELCKPDLVHLFGTEYSHTLSMIDLLNQKNIPFVVSIQGLISIYEKHYMASLPLHVQKSVTFRDFLRNDGLLSQQQKFKKRGENEINSILRSKHFIGRTTFDKACLKQINPNMTYHFNNETLRTLFYDQTWSIDKLDKHQIFTSQSYYPIKGLHHLIEAFSIVIKQYPDAKLYIAGDSLVKSEKLKDRLRQSGYARYIEKLINQYQLQNKIIYTGLLSEKEMVDQYLESSLFVLPSSIENSPNSLGEAMILGLPCVASYVGGTMDLITHGIDGMLYQHDAPYMLAHHIMTIFSDSDLAMKLASNAKKRALQTHNPIINYETLIEIYKKIN